MYARDAGSPDRAADAAASPTAQRRTAAHPMLALQRRAGNAAVAALVQRDGEDPAQAPAADAAAAGPLGNPSGATEIVGASIELASPMVTADGVLKVGTLLADSVVAASYSPGAGNAM